MGRTASARSGHELDREVNVVSLAVREELGVDLVVLDDVGGLDIGAVEHLATLLHIRDMDGGRVEPLTDDERTVVAEFEVNASGARLTVRTCDEHPGFLRHIRKTLAVQLLTLIDANGVNLTAVDFGRSQHSLVLRDIRVTVDSEGRLSGCGCLCSTSLERSEKSWHNDNALRIISVIGHGIYPGTFAPHDDIATAGVCLPLGNTGGGADGYPPLSQILKNFRKIRKKIKNMGNTNVCITSRIIFCNFV